MDDKRRLEIAMKLVKRMLREKIVFKSDPRRELPNVAKELGVSVEETAEFLKPIIKEFSDEMLATLADIAAEE